MFGSKKKGEELASIGDNYYYGLNGEKVNYEKAVEYYMQADDKNCARASFMLGLCYELGNGVEQDKDTAEAFYISAMDGGDKNAEHRMMFGELVEPSAPGADYTEDAEKLDLFAPDQRVDESIEDEEKDVPFDEAPNGLVGLETALSVTYALVQAKIISETRLEELWHGKPASIFSIVVNRLVPGDRADFFLFDPEAAWVVNRTNMQSKSLNTPWLGRTLQGRVTDHWLEGIKLL
jgi:hypothetical protein